MADYLNMPAPDLLAEVRDDATKWAAAFCQIATNLGYADCAGNPIDEGWMTGWFANAIEHSYDVRTGSGPTILLDGSAFFVADVPVERS